MTIEQLATKISYQQCVAKPEGVSFYRWAAMCKQAAKLANGETTQTAQG